MKSDMFPAVVRGREAWNREEAAMNAAMPGRPNHETSHVLIMDGDPKAAECLAMLLRLSDPDITTACAQTGHAALTIASELRPHVTIFVVGADDDVDSAVSVAGDVLARCSGARPLMIALTAAPGASAVATAPVTSAASALGRIFDHVLARPFELPNLVSLVTQRRLVMQSN